MQDIFRSQFRLPSELAEKLREEAERNNRSLNAEVVARLEGSFSIEKEGRPSFMEVAFAAFNAGLEAQQDGTAIAKLKKLLKAPESSDETAKK